MVALDSIWIGIAFILGFGVRRIGLPPMIGFLIAGFLINGFNINHSELLDVLADMGVLLLLFTIGLKLKLKSLTKRVVWGGGLLSAIISTLVFAALLALASFSNIPVLRDLDKTQILLIAFVLSFSSTVFVIKIFEERGNLNTSEGKVAVGVLIIQDILAVIFLTLSKGDMPSPWAFLLLLTPLLRPVLLWLLSKTGHGEMMILFGFAVAILGGELFEVFSLKADLGALAFGVILANDKKSNELAKNLLIFKDFFLIAFFLNIGFVGLPNVHTIVAALVISMFLFVKPLIYHFSFSQMRFPVRSSYFAAISLANYSEFGLIVGMLAAKMGWISSEIIVVIALVISFSFVLSSIFNRWSVRIFERHTKAICALGKNKSYTYEEHEEIEDSKVYVFGMGRIGTVTYDKLNEIYSNRVLGLDSDEKVVNNHQEKGRKVILHDATDTEFWNNVDRKNVHLVVLAMSDHKANMFTLNLINTTNSNIKVYGAARFDDQVGQLKEAGAYKVFNIIEEAGKGLVNDIISD